MADDDSSPPRPVLDATGSSDAARADGPLAGVLILDLSQVVSGPMAARELADQGADVIKVEPPERRDGMSGLFATVNRNKRSVIIDMKRPEGQVRSVLSSLPRHRTA